MPRIRLDFAKRFRYTASTFFTHRRSRIPLPCQVLERGVNPDPQEYP